MKGKQPIIIALARGLKDTIEPMFKKPFEDGRILFITPFDKTVKKVTEQTAMIRNKLMLELADDIVVGYVNPMGKLKEIVEGSKKGIRYIG